MKKGFISLLSVLLATITLSSSLYAAASFQGLGYLSNSLTARSSAINISDDGTTVVGSDESNYQEAFYWTQQSGMVGLGYFPGGRLNSSMAIGVSANGTIIAGSSSGYGEGSHSFYWTSQTEMVNMNITLPGVFSSYARSMTPDGSVIVGSVSNASSSKAYIWSEGKVSYIGTAKDTSASDISNDGKYVVGYINRFPNRQAYIWSQEDGMTYLGDLPGGYNDSYATSISADGTKVVGSSLSSEYAEGFLWTKENGMVGLGFLRDTDYRSQVSNISADGSVIVGFSNGQNGSIACLWDENNTAISIADALSNEGVDTTGWKLTDARGVSADGTVIVGVGYNPDGKREAWLATIPEPSTISLLLFGTAMIKTKRK